MEEPPLYAACRNGDVESVASLLAQNTDVNEPAGSGSTPLMIACHKNHIDVVRLLVQHEGLDVNRADDFDVTAFSLACSRGNAALVDLLLQQKGIDINKPASDLNRGERGHMPLSLAVFNGHLPVVKALLARDDLRIKPEEPPLLVACMGGHEEMVAFLLEHGMDANETETYGHTPLMVACKNGHVGAVHRLLRHPGVGVNKTNKYDNSALILAIQENRDAVVELLLTHQAVDVNYINDIGTTPLKLAIWQNKPVLVNMLLGRDDIDINAPDPRSGQTPLILACAKGHAEIVSTLLSAKGIRPNQANNFGRTPLCDASFRGDITVVKLLLADPSVDVHQADRAGTSPMTCACWNMRADIAALLLFHGSMPDKTDLKVLDRCLRPFFQQAEDVNTIRRRAVESAVQRARECCGTTREEWVAMHARELERLVFRGATVYHADLHALRRCLPTFVQTMRDNAASMVAFKCCLSNVPVGHALRGMSTHGEHPVRCIESFLLPCTPEYFPLLRARRTVRQLGIMGT